MSIIYVDDTNESIHYDGLWTAGPAGFNPGKSLDGISFNNTIHMLQSSGSFSFKFTGTLINVTGAYMPPVESGGLISPTWNCSVDGMALPSARNVTTIGSHRTLCGTIDGFQLEDGSHELTVSISTTGQPFYFDFIAYLPSIEVALPSNSDVSIFIGPNDTAISYNTVSDWSTFTRSLNSSQESGIEWSSMISQVNGAQFILQFYGKSLRWYGQIPWKLPHNSSHASYSIDGEPPVNFKLSGIIPPNDTTAANAQVILTLSGDSPGPHTLKAVYKGSSSEVPMSIQYFTATNGSYEDVPGTPTGRLAQVPFTTSQVSTSTATNSNGGRIAPIEAQGPSTSIY
ncbi:hypothetical protein M422DRAFT_275337 [Sphaerobolus stellatus SS14]|uniref:Uncharacterized protein n=1 Tax=Sphaerobolus stellatus (strain SS14) TaxID=990650 RepID=A0A0C9U4F5_SPHS4|nr:hypothetical protein M422DRAFT_275337 [Sphaerobolus stellatus SS14]